MRALVQDNGWFGKDRSWRLIRSVATTRINSRDQEEVERILPRGWSREMGSFLRNENVRERRKRGEK